MNVTLAKPYGALAVVSARTTPHQLKRIYTVVAEEVLKQPDLCEGKKFPLLASGNMQTSFTLTDKAKGFNVANIKTLEIEAHTGQLPNPQQTFDKPHRKIVFRFTNHGTVLRVEDSDREALTAPTREHMQCLRDFVADILNRKHVYTTISDRLLKKPHAGTYYPVFNQPKVEAAVTLKPQPQKNGDGKPKKNKLDIDNLALRVTGPDGKVAEIYQFTNRGSILWVLRGSGGSSQWHPIETPHVEFMDSFAQKLKKRAG